MSVMKLIRSWPKTSFILFSKLLSIVSFSYFLWIMELNLSFAESVMCIALYNLVVAPVSYFMTYGLGREK